MRRSSRSCSEASSASRRFEASLGLLDGRLSRLKLGDDGTELGRENALLFLRRRDLGLQLGDPLIDLRLLVLGILAGGRCREDQREREREDRPGVVACS